MRAPACPASRYAAGSLVSRSSGIGWAILEVLGGVFAILFALADVLIWVLDLGRKMGEVPPEAKQMTESDQSSKQTQS